jgi:aryl-alcohol dehydrogenase-like predicted oxidoreductase
MQFRPLGNSDINVSQICLGTMTFGAQNTEADAHSQLDLALHNDINFIDTAELYPAPASADTYAIAEQMIGRWLKRQDRSKVVLATKVVGPAPKKWIGYIRNGPQLSPAQIETALNDSLKRLHTDYIDLYQIHWPARNTNYFGKLGYEYDKDKHDYPIEETLQTLAGLKDAGKIRQLGVSNETPWGLHQYLSLAASNGLPRIATVQNPYCLLNRTFEIGMAEFAHRSNVGLLAYSPLAGGSLSGKYLNDLQPEGARLTLHRNYFYRYTTPRATDAIRQYVQIAQDHGLAPSTMAMAFVNRQPFVSSTIVGATTLAQLQENIDSVNCELDDDVIKAIQTVHQQQPNPCP